MAASDNAAVAARKRAIDALDVRLALVEKKQGLPLNSLEALSVVRTHCIALGEAIKKIGEDEVIEADTGRLIAALDAVAGVEEVVKHALEIPHISKNKASKKV